MKDEYISFVIEEYVLDGNFDAAFGGGWIDTSDFERLIEMTIQEAFAEYGLDARGRYKEQSVSLFNLLLGKNGVRKTGDDYAGHWYKLDVASKNKIVQEVHSRNPAYNRVKAIGEEALARALIKIAEEDGLGRFPFESSEPDFDGDPTNVEVVVPAANRLVPLNHNEPEYVEIRDHLDGIYEEFRGSNEAGSTEAERDRITRSLDAARRLWSSVELQVLQIRVGIIMAVEEALNALKKVTKASSHAILIDLIKNFVRDKTGINF